MRGYEEESEQHQKSIIKMVAMSSIYRTPSGTYKLQWRDRTGRLVSKTFKKRGDAVEYRDNELDKTVDVGLARRSVKWWGTRWEAALTIRPKTRAGYLSKRGLHVYPALGAMAMGDVDRQVCKEFVAGLVAKGCAPSTIRQTVAVLSGICQTACDAGALRTNPSLRLGAPSPSPAEMRFLTNPEVLRLAAATEDDQTSLIVRVAAWTGLRASELWGLQVRDVDLLNRTVTVARSWTTGLGYETTKTNRVRRVGFPSALGDDLKAQMGGREGLEPLFLSPGGHRIVHTNFYNRKFQPAVEKAEMDGLRFHDLRHTYASLLISRGLHPAAIMQRMGHSTITLTINTYGHLFPDADADVTEWLGDVEGEVEGEG